MNLDIVNRRRIYEQVYHDISSIQKSYSLIAQEISRSIGASIPSNKKEVFNLDIAEEQIVIANNNIQYLEEIKYTCGLAFLSEGALVELEELSKAINSLAEFIEICDKEGHTVDDEIYEWAMTKKAYFFKTKEALLDIMSYKLKRKLQIEDRVPN